VNAEMSKVSDAATQGSTNLPAVDMKRVNITSNTFTLKMMNDDHHHHHHQ